MRFGSPELGRRQGHAFTLVEILIVVGIIGILCAMALGSMRMARENSRMSVALNDLRLLGDAVSLLAFETGRYPGGLLVGVDSSPETWDLTTTNAGLLACNPSLFPKWKGPYVKQVSLDPWGSPYFFDPDYTIGAKVTVVVGSFGPNRRGRNAYDSDDLYVVVK